MNAEVSRPMGDFLAGRKLDRDTAFVPLIALDDDELIDAVVSVDHFSLPAARVSHPGVANPTSLNRRQADHFRDRHPSQSTTHFRSVEAT
jgi:hypothetical protein